MVCIHHGILLGHKKEQKWVICRDVDGPRDWHTEWSKSEREKQISYFNHILSYFNAYMWNLEKWYRWSYLQSRSRDTHVKDKHTDTNSGNRAGMKWEIGMDMRESFPWQGDKKSRVPGERGVSCQAFWIGILLGGTRITQPRWIPAKCILGGWSMGF